MVMSTDTRPAVGQNQQHAIVKDLRTRRLTEQEVREIRDLERYFGGTRTGRLYGIEKTLVWSIRRRKPSGTRSAPMAGTMGGSHMGRWRYSEALPISATPEPGTLALVGIGLASVALRRFRPSPE
jgi:hypothetical protein